MTNQPPDLVSLWPVEVEDAADSGALTRVIDLPLELAGTEPWAAGAAALSAEQPLEAAYRRFIAFVAACGAVHNEVDAVFAALRDLQALEMEMSSVAVLERLNCAWLRLDSEILHLAGIAPRCLDAVYSVTSDLHQVLRQLLARGVRFQGGTPPQFWAVMDALAARLAKHDRYANARGGGQ